MAGVRVEAGSALAQAIQGVVQPKLIESGWVAEENDTTLSEYVTMMIVNGKDLQGVTSELGGDLLGIGEDDPAVAAFAEWLFEQVRALSAPAPPVTESSMETHAEEAQAQSIPSFQDSPMDDASSADGVPSGPKAMRNGAGAGRGRDKRMLGQLNCHLNRDQPLPDSLRRIKGAAGGQGRINSHATRDPPRGPKGPSQNFANGVQRAMNGGGRGGRGGAMNGGANPMMQANGMMNQMEPTQQVAFMQMMEMQAAMMQQMLQGGQMPNFSPQQQQNGGGKSLFDRVDNKRNGHFNKPRQHRNPDSQTDDASMDLDSKKDPFETMCRFNLTCTNPTCPYAHQSPSAPPSTAVDLTDTCPHGPACQNTKCSARHPSPAQRTTHLKQEVDCKFFPNCTNPSCPFRHPDMPPCRRGADCSVDGCRFTHSRIMCRYQPCLRVGCGFKHVEGQRGVFKDKVWTNSEGEGDGVPMLEGEGEGENGAGTGTSDRFAGFVGAEGQGEELILPGLQVDPEDTDLSQLHAETQVVT